MATIGGPNSIVQDGLAFYVDPANKDSYPGSGTDCFNLLNTSETGSMVSSAMFGNVNAGTFIFDGVDDQLFFDNFNLGTSNTINLWVKSSDSSAAYFGPIGNDFNEYDYVLFRYQNGSLYYGAGDDTGNGGSVQIAAGSTDEWVDGKWNLHSFVRDTTNVKYYVNGQIKNNVTKANNFNNKATCVEWFGRTQGSTWLEGNITAISLYKDKALSAEEVLQNYNSLKARFI